MPNTSGIDVMSQLLSYHSANDLDGKMKVPFKGAL